MRVELVLVPDCPHEDAARRVLADAAARAGVGDLAVTVTVVDSDDEARRRGFLGSPTVLIDGVDPFAGDGGAVGLACRVYAAADGRSSGVPDIGTLEAAIVRAGAGRGRAASGR